MRCILLHSLFSEVSLFNVCVTAVGNCRRPSITEKSWSGIMNDFYIYLRSLQSASGVTVENAATKFSNLNYFSRIWTGPLREKCEVALIAFFSCVKYKNIPADEKFLTIRILQPKVTFLHTTMEQIPSKKDQNTSCTILVARFLNFCKFNVMYLCRESKF